MFEMIGKFIRRIRRKIGVPYLLVRSSSKVEWTEHDALMMRQFLHSPTGCKLRVALADAIICSAEDLKPRDWCLGMARMRDYFYSFAGQEDMVEEEEVTSDQWEFTTLPSVVGAQDN